MFSTIVPSKTSLIKNFNWREYLIANTDLIDNGILTEELAIKHYYEIGARTKRPLKSKLFDWTQYIAINSDLIEVIVKDTASAPNKTLQSANELKEMGVRIVIGPIFYENLIYLGEVNDLTFFTTKINCK